MNDNQLIAEFMRLSIKEGVCYYTDVDDMFPMGIEVEEPYLPYHTSWDWLMPVVSKIESLGYVFTIQGGKAEYGEMISETRCFIADDKLSSTYKAVVEFIETYNDEQQ